MKYFRRRKRSDNAADSRANEGVTKTANVSRANALFGGAVRGTPV